MAVKGIDMLVLVALAPEGVRDALPANRAMKSLTARLQSPTKMTSISLCKC